MQIENIYMEVLEFFQTFLEREGEIVQIDKEDDECWKAVVETLEDTEYTRKRAKRDLKAIYEVLLDNSLNIISYKKVKVVERGIPLEEESNL